MQWFRLITWIETFFSPERGVIIQMMPKTSRNNILNKYISLIKCKNDNTIQNKNDSKIDPLFFALHIFARVESKWMCIQHFNCSEILARRQPQLKILNAHA